MSRAGRYFTLPYDVVVTLAPTASNSFTNCDGQGAANMALYVDDAVSGQATASYPFALPPYMITVAQDDFDQDGFADLFILNQTKDGNSGQARVATAADINDRSQGLVFGPTAQFSAVPGGNPGFANLTDPATGDLNADGFIDVVWLGKDAKVHFSTVCPGDVSGTICAGKEALEVLVDPLNAQPISLLIGNTYPVGLASGRFVNEPGDGLVIFEPADDNGPVVARWFEFNGDF